MSKDEAACRAEFEAWARSEGVPAAWFEQNSAGDYLWGYMPQWWQMWQRRECPPEAASR